MILSSWISAWALWNLRSSPAPAPASAPAPTATFNKRTNSYNFSASLLFNLLWTPLFIAGGSARLALVDLVALDIALLVTIVLFARRSRLAAGLLVPYLGWLWFITALNATVVALN